MRLKIKTAEFISSVISYKQCPSPVLPEFAFIGRSNVGKSSLINMLCERKGLAKISSTPGKTQTINHFLVDNSWYLADLPGFGYAKTPKSLRNDWVGMISEYLRLRKNLMCTFILIDSRLEPQAIDISFMEFMAKNELPFVLVFTKTDKLGKIGQEKNLDYYKKKLRQSWEELPQLFVTSADTGAGRQELLGFVAATNSLLPPGGFRQDQ
ncbi:MAG TPA: YihA family ribosome biogenesis GTP-binding protein [Bacteroidales bacterium]|nr:MAG: YihA family ribosome biogenesis GTP-binding protein [Bacteroidetes bacterium GWE2_42_24]OFY29244.1 MAG: YihA family ribosome biogenesis GTP-binding protein [Bacteroidetes bacterium GWF2_43_11]HBZ66768.1 YihA family ribosome biogenesis GTP-binding protein [Bacteroidales bacterium]